jgi:hypothetical protein
MSNFPVAYVIFNRPRHTRETFAIIRAQQPKQLFIIADGPRPGHPTDVERCAETRAVVEQIDWPCEVHRHYAEQNMGCKLRVSSGLDWVFEHVEAAVILEDDCVPHPDFFTFCNDLLVRYAEDQRVWVVTGNNFQAGKKRGDAAYYFSKYNHCWGWATWRRAWQQYQVDMTFWPAWRDSAAWLKRVPDRAERDTWTNIFDRVYRGEIDTWDYQWTACVWYHNGLTATPNVNLVTNIGFGPDATHTVSSSDQAGLPVSPLGSLTHPEKIEANVRADRWVFDHNFGGRDHPFRFVNRVRMIFARALRAPGWVIKKVASLCKA